MLTEVKRTYQRPHEAARRWFTSETMDLMLWLDGDGRLLAFQFSHGKPQQEQALSWSRQHGLSAQKVDDGSSEGLRHKGSPLLLGSNSLDIGTAIRAFSSANQEIPAVYAGQILQILKSAKEENPHEP